MDGTPRDRQRMLGIYLNDHLMGASGGTALAARIAASWTGPDKDELSTIAVEVAEDRASLIEIMKDCAVGIDPLKVLGGRLGEKVGRLKPNARLWTRSPLSSVEEVEMLRLGVLGKASGWRTLQHLAPEDPRLHLHNLDALVTRADAQAETLERVRLAAIDDLWRR